MSTLDDIAVAICDATCSRIYALDGILAIAGAVVEINVSVNISVFFILPPSILFGVLLLFFCKKKPQWKFMRSGS